MYLRHDCMVRREEGMALIVAMMIMLLLSALGAALIMTTTSETVISGNFRNGEEGLYAADAAIERAMGDLLTVTDWNSLLDPLTITRSAFVDGAPSGTRTLPDGSTIDLAEVINVANCGHVAACSAAELVDTSKPGRPWGPNNPVWNLYAYGKLSDMMPTGTINSPFYVVVLVADDPGENDGKPLVDGTDGTVNPGTGVVSLRAEAFGPRGAHKVIEITVARTDTTDLERGYTAQRGQGEQNRRAGKKGIGPASGAAPAMQTLNLGAGGIS